MLLSITQFTRKRTLISLEFFTIDNLQYNERVIELGSTLFKKSGFSVVAYRSRGMNETDSIGGFNCVTRQCVVIHGGWASATGFPTSFPIETLKIIFYSLAAGDLVARSG